MAIIWLSYVEHTRSVRPSAILSLYLLFSLVFDIAQVRTLYLLHDGSSIPSTFSTGMGIKLALLVLEMQGKRLYLKSPFNRLSPEATSGVINQGFFWWLNDLFFRGFRKILVFDDLYEIDSGLASEALQRRIQAQWILRSRLSPDQVHQARRRQEKPCNYQRPTYERPIITTITQRTVTCKHTSITFFHTTRTQSCYLVMILV